MTRKAYALWPLAIAALVVTGSFVLLYKDRALEAWYLYRFESTHDSVRETAREGLVAVRSVRAVPLFLGSTDEALEGPAGEILKELDASGMSRLGHALLAHEPGLLLRIVALHGSLEAPRGTLAPLLKHALRSPNSGVRRYAAEELSRLGPEALPALTELRKATADQLEEVRLWASLALHGIDPERFSVSKLLAEE